MRVRRFCLVAFASILVVSALNAPLPAASLALGYSRDVVTGISLTTAKPNNFNNTGPIVTMSSDHADTGDPATAVNNSAKLDAPFAAVGANKGAATENNFILYGPDIAEGDAVIKPNLTGATNQGLGNLSGPGEANGSGTNVLQTTFTLNQADKLTLKFSANSLLQVALAAGLPDGSNASASYSFNMNIYQGTMMNQVFNWSPNGRKNADTITGGTVNSDPYNINNTISLDSRGSQMFSADGDFSATTAQLKANTPYTIVITMSETGFAQIPAANAPEPTSLLVLVLGGGGVAFWSRRRR